MATAYVEDKTILCSSCAQIKQDVIATHWCQHCLEGLCENCSQYHTRPVPSAHHMVLPLDNVQSDLKLLEKLKINTQCILHPDQAVTVFCRNHDEFGCIICISTRHNKCDNLQSIDQAVDSYASEIRNRDISNIKELLVRATKVKQELNTMKEKEIENRKCFSKFRKLFEELKNELDKKFQCFEKEFISNYDMIVIDHDNRIFALHKLQSKLSDHLKVLQGTDNFTPAQNIKARHTALIAMHAQAEESINILSRDVPELNILPGLINLKDLKLWDISMAYRKTNISEFCSQVNETMDTVSMHQSNRGTAQIAIPIVPLLARSLSLEKQVESADIFAGTRIFDATCLQENMTLLCDSENKQLIMLNEKMQFVKNMPVAGQPYGICVSSDGNIVHVVCDRNKVVSYTLQEPWGEVNRFGIDGEACGIACYGDKIITGHSTCVVIHDNTGKLVSKVKLEVGVLSIFFSEMTYLTLSHDGTFLYHTEGSNVVSRELDDVTKVVWRYSSNSLHKPCGMVTDSEGNILIVDNQSKNIHQVSPDGKSSRVLINKLKSINDPSGIFYNRKKDTFGVTSGSIYNAEMNFYQWHPYHNERIFNVQSSSCKDNVCVEVYSFLD